MSATTIEIGATVNLGLAKSGFGELSSVVQTAVDGMGANFDQLSAKSTQAAAQIQNSFSTAGASAVAAVKETGAATTTASQEIVSANNASSQSWNVVAEASVRASKALFANELAQRELKDALAAAAIAGDNDALALRRVAEATELATLAARQLTIEQRNAAAAAEQASVQLGFASREAEGGFLAAGTSVRKTREEIQEARGAAEIFGEVAGVRMNREMRGVLATSDLLGGVLSKLFLPLAALGFVDILVNIGEKMSEWISDTFILTDAQKELEAQLAKTNKQILDTNEKIDRLKGQNQLIGLSGAARTYAEASQLADKYYQKQLAINALTNAMFQHRLENNGDTSSEAYTSMANRKGIAEKELEEMEQELANKQKQYDVERQRESTTAFEKATAERLRLWNQELQSMRDSEDGNHTLSKESEADYWRSKLTLARGNSKLYSAVFHEMRAAEQADDRDRQKQATDSAKLLIAQEEVKVAATKRGTEARIQAERNVLAEIARLGLAGTVEYQAQLKKVIAAVRDYEAEISKISEISAQAQEASALRSIEAKRQQVEFEANIGRLNSKARLDELERLENAEYEIRYRGLIRRMQLDLTDPSKSPAEQARLAAQLEALSQQHEATLTKIHQTGIQQRVRIFDQFFSHISQAFKTTVQGMIMGTQTFAQGMQNIWRNIVLEFAGALAEQLMKWVAHKVAMLAIHVTTNEAMVASDAAAAAQSTSISFLASMKKIFHAAKVAAAHAFKSVMENVPFPVNVVLAPVTAAVVFAGVMALGALGSAKDGMFSQEEQLAFVHRNEMVLPAPFALGFQSLFRNLSPGNFAVSPALGAPGGFGGRSFATAGAGGGSVMVDARTEVKALDGASVSRVLRKNRTTVTREVKRAVRMANITIPKGRS